MCFYRHYAIHGAVCDRKKSRLPVEFRRFDDSSPPVQSVPDRHDTGGLFGKLQAEKSAYQPSPITKMLLPPRHGSETSNIGKSLKRKREDEVPARPRRSDENLSLVDLLKRCQSSRGAGSSEPITPKQNGSQHPAQVTYDLPAWLPKFKERPPRSLAPPAFAQSQKKISAEEFDT